MRYDALLLEAEEKAKQLSVPSAAPDVLWERYRAELVPFLNALPEPPLYHRVEDPARERAERLAQDGAALLSKGLKLLQDSPAGEDAGIWIDALKAHLEALCQVTTGHVSGAESSWARGMELQRRAHQAKRLWRRTDEERAPVYDRASGTSRYDPRPEPLVNVRLACPASACRTVAPFAYSPSYATHRFSCAACEHPFLAYFAEASEVDVEKLGAHGLHYIFRLEEPHGQKTRIEFDDAGGGDFAVAKRDLLAFIYAEGLELKAVMNLSTSRLLWVQRAGPCFIASVTLGEQADQLQTFRRFRDETLRQSALGRGAVRFYYRHGALAARWVQRRPRMISLVRMGLLRLACWLERRKKIG